MNTPQALRETRAQNGAYRIAQATAGLRKIGALEFARKHCAARFVDLADVLSMGRSTSTVRARHELWRIVHDTFGFSFPETAAVFGVDHTTIVNAIVLRPAAKRARLGWGAS